MIGTQLESSGWRQGSIVTRDAVPSLLEGRGYDDLDDIVLIIASQSCDIANNNLASDPYIEASIARIVEKSNGNLAYNKNPRFLHMPILVETDGQEVFDEVSVELKAYEKIQIPKEQLLELLPDSQRAIEAKQLDSYTSWLAARYSRPALPTEFNNRIAAADPKDKRKKKAKSANQHLSGIYVEILPDREITPEENYQINLLGLVPTDFTDNIQSAIDALNSYSDILISAGMDVTPAVRREDEVSIAVIKRFKRFYYDDLSIREDAPLPPETEVII
ncbi:hypothetical protein [Neptunomonas marina]|uniref:Uncharacterized protein n=1 Tax=Neptunomonas marina TaxID=1815562 RepID=A0A437QB93_9GAMM|nr:hypothetical protein [Neptunomonas marina]RVU31745.1 hypothetical protein EOE65_07130 [Neptunomonas marina]